jgi:uncharacterized protein YjbI with pentapeptide repeats
MSDKEHVKILRLGADVWNEWREDQFYLAPDLSGEDLRDTLIGQCYLGNASLRAANLSGMDLRRIQLHDADLSQANLNEANLSECVLTSANLFLASLVRANLNRADLQATDFRDANLTEADLSDTYLGGAVFSRATLSRANLKAATINATTFGDNDLSSVYGLISLKHGGPSIIGIQTLYRSKGNIPEEFLRGCGIPEDFISYVPSLFSKALQVYSCFISYSSKDQSAVSQIYEDLKKAGVRCWFAPQDLKTGDNFSNSLDEAISQSDKVLLVLSSNSVRSEWVRIEVQKALERELETNKKIIFPIRLDDAVLETDRDWALELRKLKHITDFRNWTDRDNYQKAISRLVRDLQLSVAIESEKAGSAQ